MEESKETVFPAGTIVTWGGFVNTFFGKYYLDYVGDKSN